MPIAVTVAAPATDLTSLPARELAALVRVGRVGARDVLEAHLARLAGAREGSGTGSGTGSRVDVRRATAQAARLETRLRHGLPGGTLAGVPVLVGSDPGPDLAERLVDAGAVLLSGADVDVAAAVATDLVPFALTHPSGVHAEASRHGLVGVSVPSVDGPVGVLARDARDARLAAAVLADLPATRFDARALRVAVVVEQEDPPGVSTTFRAWVGSLVAHGVAVTRVAPAAGDPLTVLATDLDLLVLPAAPVPDPHVLSVSLPVGVTLVARRGAEAQLLAAAVLVRHP